MSDSTNVIVPKLINMYEIPGYPIDSSAFEKLSRREQDEILYRIGKNFRNSQDTTIYRYMPNQDGKIIRREIAGYGVPVNSYVDPVSVTGINGEAAKYASTRIQEPSNNFEFEYWMDLAQILVDLTASVPALNKNPYIASALTISDLGIRGFNIIKRSGQPDYDWHDAIADGASMLFDVGRNLVRRTINNPAAQVGDTVGKLKKFYDKYANKTFEIGSAAANTFGALCDLAEPIFYEFFTDDHKRPENYIPSSPGESNWHRFTHALGQIDWGSFANHTISAFNSIKYGILGGKKKTGNDNSTKTSNTDRASSESSSKPADSGSGGSGSGDSGSSKPTRSGADSADDIVGSSILGTTAVIAGSSIASDAKANAQPSIVLPDISQSIENPGRAIKRTIAPRSIPNTNSEKSTPAEVHDQSQSTPAVKANTVTGQMSNTIGTYRNVPATGSSIIKDSNGIEWIVLPNTAGNARKFKLKPNYRIEYDNATGTVRYVPGESNLIGGGVYDINGLSIEDRRPIPTHKSGGSVRKMQDGSNIPLKNYSLGSNTSFDPTKKYDFFYSGSLDGTKPGYKWSEDGNGKWSYDSDRKQFYYDVPGEYDKVIGDEYEKLKKDFAMTDGGGLTLPALTNYAKSTGSVGSYSTDSGYNTRIYAPDIIYNSKDQKYTTVPYTEADKYSYTPVQSPDVPADQTKSTDVAGSNTTQSTASNGSTTNSATGTSQATTTSTTGTTDKKTGSASSNAGASTGNGEVFSDKEADENAKTLAQFLSSTKFDGMKEGNYAMYDNVLSEIVNTTSALGQIALDRSQWNKTNFAKRRIPTPNQQTSYNGNYYGLNEAYNAAKNINQQAYLYDGIKDDANAQMNLKSALNSISGTLTALGQDANARQQSKAAADQINYQNAVKNAKFGQDVADDQYEMKHNKELNDYEAKVRAGEEIFNLPQNIAGNLKKQRDENIALYGKREVANSVALINAEKNKANMSLKLAMANANENIKKHIDKNWNNTNDFYALSSYLDSHPYYDHNGQFLSHAWGTSLKNAFETAESWKGIDPYILASRKIYSDFDDTKGNAGRYVLPKYFNRNDDNGRRSVVRNENKNNNNKS